MVKMHKGSMLAWNYFLSSIDNGVLEEAVKAALLLIDGSPSCIIGCVAKDLLPVQHIFINKIGIIQTIHHVSPSEQIRQRDHRSNGSIGILLVDDILNSDYIVL